MNTKYLTTGQAALEYSVSPDTILKWIRSGFLPARRTAGGHHRINELDLNRLLQHTESTSKKPIQDPKKRRFRYCWEFNGNGQPLEGCKSCAVYMMRAQRCYEMPKIVPDTIYPKTFCRNSCEDCDYYKHVREQSTNVLVVTNDPNLIKELHNEASSAYFNLQIVDCEYSCSTVVSNFRPDYAVVDCHLGPQVSLDITYHLIEDPRIPFIRVVLAGSNEDDFPTECEKVIFARMRRPFGITAISKCIDGNKQEHPDQTSPGS